MTQCLLAFSKNKIKVEANSEENNIPNKETIKICFIKHVGKSTDNLNIYDLIGSYKHDSFWGDNFEYKPCGLCNEIIPSKEYIDEVYRIETSINLDLIQDSNCMSMQDCMDGIIAIAWENIDDYETYPEEGRIVVKYGIEIDDISKMLEKRHIKMNKIKLSKDNEKEESN